jgi:cyclin B
MLTACKYEEIYPPELRDFIYVCDKAYTQEMILRMESEILYKLDFEIVTVSAFRFLERFSLSLEPNQKCFFLCQFLLELALVDCRLNYPSSLKATSVIVLSRKILKLDPVMPFNLQKASGYPREMLENCIKDLCTIIEASKRSTLREVRSKFSNSKYQEVSKLPLFND